MLSFCVFVCFSVSSIAFNGAIKSANFAGLNNFFHFFFSFPPFHINLLHFGGFQCVLELKLLLLLQPMLQELGKQNPQLLRLIQEHQTEFLQLINEPVDGSEG